MTNFNVVLLYLSQVTQQPGLCGRFAEAGQPVHVPGVSHQEPRRPGSNHCTEPCSEQQEDLAEASRAEEEINYALQRKHGSGDKQMCRRPSHLPCLAGSKTQSGSVETNKNSLLHPQLPASLSNPISYISVWSCNTLSATQPSSDGAVWFLRFTKISLTAGVTDDSAFNTQNRPTFLLT